MEDMDKKIYEKFLDELIVIVLVSSFIFVFGIFLYGIEPVMAGTLPEIQYKQTFTTTGYSAIETCGNTCTMASGKQAYYGAIACPRYMSLGTQLNIQGFGIMTCEDRTANWTEGRVDIFFGYAQSDYQQALQFGKQQLKASVIK